MQGWTAQCTTLLAYSIFAIGVGSYDAYRHEHEGGSLHTGVRQRLHSARARPSVALLTSSAVCCSREQWIAALCVAVPIVVIYVDDAMDGAAATSSQLEPLLSARLTVESAACTGEKNFTVVATWIGLLFMGLWPEVWLLTQSYYTATHWANVSSGCRARFARPTLFEYVN